MFDAKEDLLRQIRLSAAAMSGHVALTPDFAWLATWPAVLALSWRSIEGNVMRACVWVASAFEIGLTVGVGAMAVSL